MGASASSVASHHRFRRVALARVMGALRDAEIRTAVRARTARLHTDDPEVRLVEELDLAVGARADVVVLNGRIEGYEIKSDVDSLVRLAHQSTAYEAICDRVWLVTTERFAERATETLPSWWGLLVARERRSGVVLVRRRAARAHRAQQADALAGLLWRAELVALCERLGLDAGPRRATAAALRARVSMRVPPQRLANEVRAALLVREGWRAAPPSASGDASYPPSARWSSSRSRLPAHRQR